jgi:hypothetical protein
VEDKNWRGIDDGDGGAALAPGPSAGSDHACPVTTLQNHPGISSQSIPDSPDADINIKNEPVFNSKVSFPLNLLRMLETVEGLGLSHIVSWAENERSFVIYDVDLFLIEVLPKFFSSSENTKIRSFYRKLNRWGFSMSRKNANNPDIVWHHPDFNRSNAVLAMKQALETGKVGSFLSMSSVSRGKKRRERSDPRANGNDLEGTDAAQDDLSPARRFSVGVTSMPALPVSSHGNGRSRFGLSHSFTTGSEYRQCSQRGRLSGHMLSGNRLRCSANDSFDLIPSRQGGLFDPFELSVPESIKSLFDLGNPSTRFLLPPSSTLGPSPNILTRSAEETFDLRRRAMGLNATMKAHQDNRMSKSQAKEFMHDEMTQEEDDELTEFFGKFAESMPVPKEGEERCSGEPDPLPNDFNANYS